MKVEIYIFYNFLQVFKEIYADCDFSEKISKNILNNIISLLKWRMCVYSRPEKRLTEVGITLRVVLGEILNLQSLN